MRGKRTLRTLILITVGEALALGIMLGVASLWIDRSDWVADVEQSPSPANTAWIDLSLL